MKASSIIQELGALQYPHERRITTYVTLIFSNGNYTSKSSFIKIQIFSPFQISKWMRLERAIS
jgi:hypothetical protein